MSTRSPMNKRTQEQLREGRSGMARKSAAAAKPARAAASSVRVVPASSKARRKQAERGESLAGLSREEKRARKQQIRAHEDRVYAASNILMRENPAYAKQRMIWYAFMVVGVFFILIAFALLAIVGERANGMLQLAQYGAVGVSYVAIIGGFIFDFIKIRPIRNEARSKAEGMTDSRLNAVLERGAKAEEAKRARRAAKGKDGGKGSEQDAGSSAGKRAGRA
ncbi:MAG: hypothetical protein SOY67_07295 [Collinsella sp.]|nr:hypothetical protein [Collinsella sp.]